VKNFATEGNDAMNDNSRKEIERIESRSISAEIFEYTIGDLHACPVYHRK